MTKAQEEIERQADRGNRRMKSREQSDVKYKRFSV